MHYLIPFTMLLAGSAVMVTAAPAPCMSFPSFTSGRADIVTTVRFNMNKSIRRSGDTTNGVDIADGFKRNVDIGNGVVVADAFKRDIDKGVGIDIADGFKRDVR